jgi:hypothetical protein
LGRVLDRERVELEDVAEEREVVVSCLLEIEPEERAGVEALLDPRRVHLGFDGACLVDQMPSQAEATIGPDPDGADASG